MRQDHAEDIGAQALAWLVRKEDLLRVFLGSTGASPDDLRAAAEDPAIFGAVLEFVCMDDEWITEFCAETGVNPDEPFRARSALPGGQTPHWT